MSSAGRFLPRSGFRSSAPPSWRLAASPHRRQRGWPTATQLLPPPSPAGLPLMGLLNVRLFRVEGSNRDVVMDTLGLQVFGLPDLQCHWHDLELPRLAAYLRNAGTYIFDRGDVIRDGDTIEGWSRGEKWRCLQEKALIPPDRLVIDLDPGEGYAAGQRFR